MELRYLRHHAFNTIRRPISLYFRKKRMQEFARAMNILEGMSILDLGGQPGIWQDIEPSLNITVLNLPGAAKVAPDSHHYFTFVECDACDVKDIADRSFDIVFSNSVIEHVGPEQRQRDFAREVQKFHISYWIQTPSIWFPIEAHTGMPFWWLYPDWLREYFFRGWKNKLPAWTESMQDTRVLSKSRMRDLFPQAQIFVETWFGIPKSYAAWRCIDRVSSVVNR